MEISLLPRLILALSVLSTTMTRYRVVEGAHTLSLGGSLRVNDTIASQNGTFELGFFNPNGTNNWYLGIWYASVSERAYVWVANRENPVKNMPCILNLSKDGQLGLFDAEGVSLWSSNGSKPTSDAVLLDSGNFVLRSAENKSETVWESFNHPVDTLLPGMNIGGKAKLVSWRNSMDPAPGIFSLEIDQSSVSQFVLRWKDSVQYWQSGSWNGDVFANIPEMSGSFATGNVIMENTTSGRYFKYTVPAGINFHPRFVMDKTGAILMYTLIDGNRWSMFWSLPREQCEIYGLCGVYGTCNSNNTQFCSCPRGFKPRDEQTWGSHEWWSAGCVRRSPLNCGAKNSSVDQFIAMNMWLPDNNNSHDRSYAATRNDCEKACLANCSCTAFKYMSNICQIWRGDLISMRDARPKNDSDVFLRLAASEFGSSSYSKGGRNKIALVLGVISCAIVLAILACSFWRRSWMRTNKWCADAFGSYLALRFTVASCCTPPEANEVDATKSIRMFTYKELQISTRSFKYKLGGGAFGSVFRGTLPDGQLVAVKKLQGTGQGEKQFRAEINTVGNINHVNLIRLRGFCAEKSERLLVYDYMPTGSLNTILFSNKSKAEREVDWKTRFEIALGVARGLMYLHEECKERIIHGDVKPENILLDDNFCPKLADFGLAKIVGRNFSRVLTTTRGTRGYLAPEWISGLPITPKADVYSFGMTLLEVISGRRNLDLTVPESSKLYFPTWAATQIYKEDIMSLVDSRIANSADEGEVRRAGVVSMLCIQDDEAVRPSMAQVLLMLEGKTEVQTPRTPRSLFIMMDQQRGQDDSDNSG